MSNTMLAPSSEENYPLLLLFLEDGKESSRKKNKLFFEKNRYQRITEGASNVITQWPGHVSTCWLSASIFFLCFFILFLILIFATLKPQTILPRCISNNLNTSNTKIYLVHDDEKWYMNQFEAVEEIIQNYPNVKIELIVLHNTSHKSDKSADKIRQKREQPKHNISLDLNINVGNRSILKTIKYNPIHIENSTRKSIGQMDLQMLLKTYPIIYLRNVSMAHYFSFTPLYAAWRKLNPELLNFAARSLRIWEFAGISFKLPVSILPRGMPNYKPKISVHNGYNSLYEEEWRIDSLIKSNLSSFNDLPEGVVNIDDEGLHMETKTQCHAYFGELLSNLRIANYTTSVEDVVRKTLKTFCLNGAVNDEYCFRFFLV